MTAALSEKIVTYAIRNNFFKSEQHEEYSYALQLVLNIVITDITLILIGFLMGMIWECIVFWLLYKVLRKYCGGYHFSTSLRCYLSSCIMCPIILLTVQFVPYNIWIWSTVTAVAAIVLFILSPVPAINKPLDDKEICLFKRIARVLILLFAVFFAVMTLFKLYKIAAIISLSVVCVTVFVVVGKLAWLHKKQNI